MSTLVGKPAPDFSAQAVINGEIVKDFTLSQYKGKKYVLLFFYPKDFSLVCPVELVEFQKLLPEFEKRGVQVVGCSTDSELSHLAWVNTPHSKGGVGGVTYPLVSDINKTIAVNYGTLAGTRTTDAAGKLTITGELIAYRGAFLIDKNGIVRHEVINDFVLVRSVEDELRTIDSLQHFEQFGEFCPMSWKKGEKAVKLTGESLADYLTKGDK